MPHHTTMPRRLQTTWSTLTQAARRAHPLGQDQEQEQAPPQAVQPVVNEEPFNWANVDMEEQLQQEPAQDPYPGQEPAQEQEPVQGQELTPLLWPDQVVAVNSFDTCAPSRRPPSSGWATKRSAMPLRPPS